MTTQIQVSSHMVNKEAYARVAKLKVKQGIEVKRSTVSKWFQTAVYYAALKAGITIKVTKNGEDWVVVRVA